MSKEKQSFEASLKELEQIVKALESGDLPLEEAVKKYEEGIKFSQHCQNLLKEAESVLTKMMKNGEETDFELNNNEE